MLKLTKLKGVGNLEYYLKYEDTESGVCPVGFQPCLVQYFFTMLLFLSFGMLIYLLCHYILKICDLLLDLILQGVTIKRLPESQKRLWTFK